jgi:hypothetical protein
MSTTKVALTVASSLILAHAQYPSLICTSGTNALDLHVTTLRVTSTCKAAL